MNLPDGRTFDAYRADIDAYRQRQGLKPISQTGVQLLFEQAARQIPMEAPAPVTVTEHADDEEAFRDGILMHLRAGYDAQRDLLWVRWDLARWLRPYVQPGRPKKPGTGSGVSDQDGTGSGFSARTVFEDMRASGKVSIRWSSLLRYLPLAEHEWDTINDQAHTVKGALKWCADFKRTPEERNEAKRDRQERKLSVEKRADRDRLIIRDLSAEVLRLKALVDADLVAVVDDLRQEVAALRTENTAKDRRIEYLQVQAAHHRLSVRGSLKVVGDRGKWCKECANPPASCDCASVPAVTANGNGAAKGDLFGHARISLPGQA